MKHLLLILTISLSAFLCLAAIAFADAECDKHIWGEWVIDQEATCLADGHQYRECSNCHAIEEDTIPSASAEHSWSD